MRVDFVGVDFMGVDFVGVDLMGGSRCYVLLYVLCGWGYIRE